MRRRGYQLRQLVLQRCALQAAVRTAGASVVVIDVGVVVVQIGRRRPTPLLLSVSLSLSFSRGRRLSGLDAVCHLRTAEHDLLLRLLLDRLITDEAPDLANVASGRDMVVPTIRSVPHLLEAPLRNCVDLFEQEQ
jgi:hypothetical protein